MGCNFANTFMWVEQYIAVTSKIAGFMSVGAGIGVNIAPFLIGQLINDLPMILIYLQVKNMLHLTKCLKILCMLAVGHISRSSRESNSP